MSTWCSKHVKAWNKLIAKQKFCASSWLITKINILRCTVSKTSKFVVCAHVGYRIRAVFNPYKNSLQVDRSDCSWWGTRGWSKRVEFVLHLYLINNCTNKMLVTISVMFTNFFRRKIFSYNFFRRKIFSYNFLDVRYSPTIFLDVRYSPKIFFDVRYSPTILLDVRYSPTFF